MDAKQLRKFLNLVDYSDIDTGELKLLLLKRGWKEDVINTVLGEAEKKYEAKKKFQEYVELLVRYVKPFVERGHSEYYIRRNFVSKGWNRDVFEEAYKQAEKDVIYDRKSILLEKEILKRLITGENKEHVIRVILKKGWPDDFLKKNFETIEHGLDALKGALHEFDLNHYNKDDIKDVLIKKGWPEQLVDKTLKNLIEKIEYHRDLQRIQNEIRAMIHLGKTTKEIDKRLRDEGYPERIIKKIMWKMNVELVHIHDIDHLKKFNQTQLKHRNYHNYSQYTSYLVPLEKSEIKLDIPETLRKEKHEQKKVKT